MEDKVIRILREFSLLSRLEKQHRIVQWVKKESEQYMPILRKIASEDSEVQIRYLARKALFHLKKRQVSPKNVADTDIEKLKILLLSQNIEEGVGTLEFFSKKDPKECARVVETILDQIQDPFLLASSLIAIGKSEDGDYFELLKNFLSHKDSRVRASCIEAIGNLPIKDTTPWLIRALHDSDNRIRANAIRALKIQGRKQVFESLQEMVHSKEVWMRNSAAFAIGEYKSAEILELLLKLLDDSNPSVSKMAFKSLEKLSGSGVLQAELLLEKLKKMDKEESVRDFIQLTEIQETEPSISHEDSRIRLLEINKIVQEKMIERYKELESRLVVEEDDYVKASLLLALGRVRQESAVDLIKTFLKSPIPRLRANAIEALCGFGKMEYLPQIVLHLQETNNRARANSIVALKNMPYVDIISPLKEMAGSDKLSDQQSAFYAITEIATQEAFALFPLLAQKCKDEALKKNIRDFVTMNEAFIAETVLTQLYTLLDFTQESDFGTEEIPVEEEKLESEYTEADFDGFLPDNLKNESVRIVTLEKFLVASPQEKVIMIEKMKSEITQEHFTLLRLAERDRDFQVKCLSKIALNNYRGRNFKQVDLDELETQANLGSSKDVHPFLSAAQILRRTFTYEGKEEIQSMNLDLEKRTAVFKIRGKWEGRFHENLAFLSALRIDTQEMLASALGEEIFHLKAATICYYSPTYKPYMEGLKSLDGANYENFIQLHTYKSTLLGKDELDPIESLICAIPSPKYLLVLITRVSVVLFLRHTLGYSRAEVIQIPLDKIIAVHLSKEENNNDLLLNLSHSQDLKLPKLNMKNAKELHAILSQTL